MYLYRVPPSQGRANLAGYLGRAQHLQSVEFDRPVNKVACKTAFPVRGRAAHAQHAPRRCPRHPNPKQPTSRGARAALKTDTLARRGVSDCGKLDRPWGEGRECHG